MIDEKATLKALVQELREKLESYVDGDLGMQQVAGDALDILAKYRDNPVRCEGGGSIEFTGRHVWDMPDYGAAMSIAPQPTQAERDAAQEAEWRALFEAQ